jgi:hypothetical protein
MRYFDYETVAHAAGIGPEALAAVRLVVEREFPDDPMMCELHVLRACTAIRDGLVRLEDILHSEAPPAGEAPLPDRKTPAVP